jgi:hypothetical protein
MKQLPNNAMTRQGPSAMKIREEIAEWKHIQQFVAACRRQWPGAKIVLRPDTDAASRCKRGPTSETQHPATKEDSNG